MGFAFSQTPSNSNVLPGSPNNGDTVAYRVLLSSGTQPDIWWMLRYHSSSAYPNKWVFLGGAPLYNSVLTAEATASVSAVDLATVGPQITLPLTGMYQVRFGAMVTSASGGILQLTTGSQIITAEGVGGGPNSIATETIVEAPASTVLKVQYLAPGAVSSTFSKRYLTVTPVGVG